MQDAEGRLVSAELKSVLTRRDVFALGFGAIIGWGWVVLSGSMIERAGTLGSMLAVIAGAVMVGLVGLTYAELTSALPRAGGEVAFTYRALGQGWAWLCGWALVLAYIGVCAFEAVALATVFGYLFPDFRAGYLYSVAGSEVYASWVLVGVLAGVFIAVVNWLGIKSSALLQQVSIATVMLVGAAFFLGGVTLGDTANLAPHFTTWGGLLGAMVLMPFLMVGFDVIPQAAEEMNIPRREIGKILLLSIAMAAVWYMFVQWSVGVGVPHDRYSGSDVPTADAAAGIFGTRSAALVLIGGGFLGIMTSWNAFFVGGTRLLFGLGRARMLPPAFARLHRRYQTPTFAILFVALVSLIAPFFGRQALVWVADAAGLAIVCAYFLVAIAFVRLRQIEPEMPRPYRVRYGRAVGYAAVAVTFGFILLYLPFSPAALVWHEWFIILTWALLGVVVFRISRRPEHSISPDEQARIIFGEYAR